MILVGSQVAVRTIASVWRKSHFIRECKKHLRTFRPNEIRLWWDPGHSGTRGIETTDALARLGSLSEEDLLVAADTAIFYFHLITGCIKEEEQRRQGDTSRCYVSRGIWPDIDSDRIGLLLDLDKASLRLVISLITAILDC